MNFPSLNISRLFSPFYTALHIYCRIAVSSRINNTFTICRYIKQGQGRKEALWVKTQKDSWNKDVLSFPIITQQGIRIPKRKGQMCSRWGINIYVKGVSWGIETTNGRQWTKRCVMWNSILFQVISIKIFNWNWDIKTL